eukprot:g1483.t1
MMAAVATDHEGIMHEYEISDRVIGRGSFGSVFEAVHLESKCVHAVKIIDLSKVNEENRRHLNNEISIMQTATKAFTNGHPHIVRLFGQCCADNQMYLFMEFCKGGSLRQLIRKRGTLTESEAKTLMHQLRQGLQFLREQNVIHRDLKPDNLLLTSEDMSSTKLKIADFGLARVLNIGSMAQTMCGSPLYMAPELFLNGNACDYNGKVDLWSVGAVLFEMVAGRPVFNVQSIAELMEAIRKDPKLTFEPGKLSAVCKDLIQRLLRVDPANRISYSEFLEHEFLLPELPQDDDTNDAKVEAQASIEKTEGNADENQDDSEDWEWDMLDDFGAWVGAAEAVAGQHDGNGADAADAVSDDNNDDDGDG